MNHDQQPKHDGENFKAQIIGRTDDVPGRFNATVTARSEVVKLFQQKKT